MTCFVKEWLQLKGPDGQREKGAFELNLQHCDGTQREIYERDELRIQHEKKNEKNKE